MPVGLGFRVKASKALRLEGFVEGVGDAASCRLLVPWCCLLELHEQNSVGYISENASTLPAMLRSSLLRP